MKLIIFLMFLCWCDAQMHYVANENTLHTNTTMWVKATMLTLNLEQTSYAIDWNAEIVSFDSQTPVEVRFLRDMDVINHFSIQASTGWSPVAGFYLCYISTGEHDFSIEFRSQTVGSEVYIRRSRIRVEEKYVKFAPSMDMQMKKHEL